MNKEILSRKLIEESGSLKRYQLFKRGKHEGKIHHPDKTWSGDFETESQEQVIEPVKKHKII